MAGLSVVPHVELDAIECTPVLHPSVHLIEGYTLAG